MVLMSSGTLTALGSAIGLTTSNFTGGDSGFEMTITVTVDSKYAIGTDISPYCVTVLVDVVTAELLLLVLVSVALESS